MYTTRPLSMFKNSPEALSQPPDGPNSGYLVIQDDESTPTYCFGLCKSAAIKDVPFPQNKLLTIEYHVQSNGVQSGQSQYHSYDQVYLIPVINQPLSSNLYYAIKADGNRKGHKNAAINDVPFPQNKLLIIEYHVQSGETQYHSYDHVYLIPVINQPLSSNLYYAIKADGNHKGEAYTSSKEDDKITCCFCIPCIQDVKPRPFDVQDIYQQFEFCVTKTCFNTNMLSAKSVASDGHPPKFLRQRGWQMNGKTPRNFTMEEALGVNSTLRARLPDFNFPISLHSSNSLVVGKWYCPFVFVREYTQKEQIKNSVFYEMCLEQRWERIFDVDSSDYSQEKAVMVDVVVPTKVVRIKGQQCEEICKSDDNVIVWYKGRDEEVGLSKLIVERMRWEEERLGWVKGDDKLKQRIVKEEVYGGVIGWRSFGCYVLVESFVLKKNGGSVVIACDYLHTHQLRSKWE